MATSALLPPAGIIGALNPALLRFLIDLENVVFLEVFIFFFTLSSRNALLDNRM